MTSTEIIPPEPEEIRAFVQLHGLTLTEFAAALGYSDLDVGRRLAKGFKNEKPFRMSGTATRALQLLSAVHKLVRAREEWAFNQSPDTEERLDAAFREAAEFLPKRMRP